MRRRSVVPVLFLLAIPPAAAAAAGEVPSLVTLRPQAVVEEAALRLGDLFDGIADARRAAAVVGPAPGPGRRVVLEAAQLAAVARAHGLAWRPLTAQDRVVVDRPGRPVPRADIEAALRAELIPLGLDPEAALEMVGLVPPLVPPAGALHLSAEAASLEAASGRFAATLVVAAEGLPVQRLRLAGRAVATVPAVVPARRIGLGEVVEAGDLRAVRIRAEMARPGMAQAPEQVVGQRLRRPVGADLPILLTDLSAPALVEKNALVTLVVEVPGMQLAAQGCALEAGPRGGLVPVMNLSSRAVVEGEVIGPGRVRAVPGAVPVLGR